MTPQQLLQQELKEAILSGCCAWVTDVLIRGANINSLLPGCYQYPLVYTIEMGGNLGVIATLRQHPISPRHRDAARKAAKYSDAAVRGVIAGICDYKQQMPVLATGHLRLIAS